MVMDPYVAVHFQHIFVANSIGFHRVVTPVNNEVLSSTCKYGYQVLLNGWRRQSVTISSTTQWVEAFSCFYWSSQREKKSCCGEDDGANKNRLTLSKKLSCSWLARVVR